MSDIVQFVLGDIQDVQSRLQIQRPEVQLINPASGEVTGIVKSDVPDLILVTGSLPETDRIVNGASISLRFRRGQAFQGEPALRWTISGEKGEIRLISHSGPGINAISDNVVIEVHDFETDSVQNIAWDWGSYIELPSVARNTGALYDAFASGNTATYADFEHGLRRHRQLDEILTGLRT